jgi:outer membrane protein assembly factor BamB
MPILILLVVLTLTQAADAIEPAINWPSFRGPAASGVADGAEIPTAFSTEKNENIRWKTAIPGLGHSCPIVWGDCVYVTTAISSAGESKLKVGLYGDPTSALEKKVEHSFRVYCLDKHTGKVLWQKEPAKGIPKTLRHPKASHANCTPATDGKNIVVNFGAEGLYCYDLQGSLLWKKDLGVLDAGPFDDPTNGWGFASSPVIHDGKIVIQADTFQNGFLAVLDIADGRELWRTPRKDVCTWGTPAVLKTAERTQIIVNGYKHIGGYDLADGKEVWKLRGGGDAPVCTPIVANDLVFITNAHGPLAPIYAIDTAATGKIAASENSSSRYVAWYYPRGGNYMQTPIVYGDLAYFCRDNGVLTCYDAKTGEKHYSERLGKGTTGFTASAVASDGRLFFASEEGDVFVVKAGPKFELLARNSIGEHVMATPAITDGALLVRGEHHLIAVGSPVE